MQQLFGIKPPQASKQQENVFFLGFSLRPFSTISAIRPVNQ